MSAPDPANRAAARSPAIVLATAIVGLVLQVAMLAGCNVADREVIRCSSSGAELPVIDVFELSPDAGTARLILRTRPREGRLTTTDSAHEMLFEASPDDHRLQLKLNRVTGKGQRIIGESTAAAGEHLHPLLWTVECAPYDVTPSDRWLLENGAN